MHEHNKLVEKENLGLYDTRIETKLSLRKVKIKDTLSKLKINSSNIPFRSNKFNETTFLIDTEKLGLKSDILNKKFEEDEIEEYAKFYINLLKSEDINKAKYAITVFRNIIIALDSKIPPELLSLEFLSSLYILLSNNKYQLDIVYEILWIMINVSCYVKQDKVGFFLSTGMVVFYNWIFEQLIISKNIEPHISNTNTLITSNNDDLISSRIFSELELYGYELFSEMILWILGNVSQEDFRFIKILERYSIIDKVIHIYYHYKNDESSKLAGKALWTIICVCKHVENFSLNKKTILCNIVCEANIKDSYKNELLWALSYLADSEEMFILTKIFESGKLKYYINLFFETEEKHQIIFPLSRLIGNISLLCNNESQKLIDWKVLDIIVTTLNYHQDELSFYAIWVLSNLVIDNEISKNLIVDLGFFSYALLNFLNNRSAKIKTEAAYLIGNTIYNCSKELVMKVHKLGYLKTILEYISLDLNTKDVTFVEVLLSGVLTFIKYGEHFTMDNNGVNPFTAEFVERDGIQTLERLYNMHESSDIIVQIVNVLRNNYLDSWK